ncbi:T9SS type B sorting domain-containing protein [Aquimarina macrocephali]|uniref:T9SS type B sorting domain-containing protein n=1 Tax=Aquimarina macrocephali TaxID=666563 RepID=UPI00046376F3|nr:gliding motility-associated C-terminal domain-containing protein [Aquimarina macrocephali]
MKKKLNLISLIAIVTGFLFSSLKANAQDINAPLFSISGSTTTILCVNQNVPNREAVAQTPSGFGPNTEYILELSDETGLFSANTTRVLTTFTSSVAIPPNGTITFPSFAIPTDLRGENYSLRVNVPASNILSAVQENIPIYYFDFSQGVTLTGANIEANTVALCIGESATLTALPGDFPEYIWSFDATGTNNFTVVPGESGNTLENVTQVGTYKVQVNFGSCNALFNFDSQTVEVIDFNETTVRINEPSPQSFCPSDVKILTTSVTDPGFTYEWFKDGVLIPEFDGPSEILPESNFGGFYTVNVTGTPTCNIITTPPVEVINLGSDILTKPPPLIMLLPTQPTLTLSITTNAPAAGSTVEWFRNGISIQGPLAVSTPGALSFDVTNPGIYRVDVFANDVCMDTLQATTEVFEPVGFRTQISTLLDCDADTGTLGLENLFGITSTGLEVPIITDQYSLFDFEWFLGTQSTGVTETTFTVTSANIGEVYALEATLRSTSFPTARSNDLTVEFLSDVVVIEASPTFIPFGETSTLSVPQSSNYAYEWFIVVDGENQSLVDGSTVISGQGTNSIEIDTIGDYFVRITLLDCVIDSEILNISDVAGSSEIIPNVVTPNSDGINDNWLLPPSLFNQQEVEVTIYNARGQVDFTSPSYQNNWPRENSKSSGQDPFYYYIITKNNSVVRKGSITVMR